MQYVFLIRSRAGGKKYVTRRSRVTYFLPPALERIKNTYCMGQRPFLYFYWSYHVIMSKIIYALPAFAGQLTADDMNRMNKCYNHERLCVEASHTLLWILKKSLIALIANFFQGYPPWSLFTPSRPTPS